MLASLSTWILASDFAEAFDYDLASEYALDSEEACDFCEELASILISAFYSDFCEDFNSALVSTFTWAYEEVSMAWTKVIGARPCSLASKAMVRAPAAAILLSFPLLLCLSSILLLF